MGCFQSKASEAVASVAGAKCHEPSAIARTSTKALAMQGGGFHALATDVGLISGLLAFTHGDGQTTASLQSLLGDIDYLSTGSGSTWFMISLAYSHTFSAMVESMGQDLANAESIFKDKWVTPLKGIETKPDDGKALKQIRDWIEQNVQDEQQKAGLLEDIDLFSFLISTGVVTWQSFVTQMLEATAGLDENAVLGDAVCTWAAGKTFMINASLLVPGRDPLVGSCRLWEKDRKYVGYSVTDPIGTVNNVLPMAFPVRMSDSSVHLQTADRPLVPGLSQGITFSYDASEGGSSMKTPRGLITSGVNVGRLPVVSVAGASSAAAAPLDILPKSGAHNLTTLMQSLVGFGPADLVSAIAADGPLPVLSLPSFATAAECIRRIDQDGPSSSGVQFLCDNGVVALGDSGVTEGTGIGAAIAAGANEVVAVLNCQNSEHSDWGIYDWTFLFQLFKGGKPAYPDDAFIFPIFNESVDVIKPDEMSEITAGSGQNYRELAGIKLGSVSVTTSSKGRVYFGIPEGTKVTLHIVNISSKLSIGQMVDTVRFGALAGDIANALGDQAGPNATIVRETLLPMFRGSLPSLLDSIGRQRMSA